MTTENHQNSKSGSTPKTAGKKPYVQPELTKKQKLAEIAEGTPQQTS